MSNPPLSANGSGLHGRHIVITRPAASLPEDASEDALARQLKDRGAQVSCLPLVTIQPTPFSVDPQETYDWLFFTSQNAARSFFQNHPQETLPQFKRIAVVGPATGQCVQALGYPVDFISPEFHAASAAKAFSAAYSCQGLRILWPCGNLANPDLQEILQAAGVMVDPLVVYHTTLKSQLSVAEQQTLQQAVAMVVFTSPSAIEAWAALQHQFPALLPNTPVACLGPKTTQAALKQLGRADVQANPHTLDALAQAILIFFMEGNRV